MKTPDTVIEIGARCLETSHRVALKLTGGLDIGGQVSREDAANSYIVALRYRF